MLYVNNLPVWECVLRGLMAIAAIELSYHFLGVTPSGLGADAMAAMIAMTGVVGFCPACALAGRKLKSGKS